MLVIYRKMSVISYKRVVIHKLLNYTWYAMQLLWKSAHVKPLLDMHTVYSFEFAQSYFRPIGIWDWFAHSWIRPLFNFLI